MSQGRKSGGEGPGDVPEAAGGATDLERLLREARSELASLRASEAGLRALVETFPASILVHRDGRLAYANAVAVRTLGYDDGGELLGRPVLDLVHPDDRAWVIGRIGAIVENGASTTPHEVRCLRRDGRTFVAEIQGCPVIWNGQPSVVTVGRDVGERKQMQARLLLADRLASLGKLVAGIAHEINNPLAYLMANLRFITDELSDVPGLPESSMVDLFDALEDAGTGAERVRLIVRDLETFTRVDDEERGPIDVRRVVETSLSLAWADIRQRARVEKDLGEVPRAVASEARLGQVFIGLLTNAAEAMSESDSERNVIRVRTYGEEGGGGSRVVVEIADNGPGIAPEHLPHLFEPFFTTKPFGEGKGLGLCMSQGVVAGFGGQITVESELGRGSVFRVKLPAEPRREPAPLVLTPPAARRGQVLIIDDEPMILTSLRRLLLAEHDVTPVSSAREALGFLTAGRRFDLILCDLMMPGMTGMEFFEVLQTTAPDQVGRVVFMTGGAFTPRARQFLDEVANRTLHKPFDGPTLRALLRDVLG